MRMVFGVLFSFLLVCSAAAEMPGGATFLKLEMAAAKAAELDPLSRYAFTLERNSKTNGDDAVSIKARFDPRRPAGERWRLVDQDVATADEQTLEALMSLQKSKENDDALVYDKLSELLGEAELIEETEKTAIFVAPIDDDELPEDVLVAEVTLDKTLGYVSKIAVRSTRAFKPVLIAKVKSLSQIQHYAAPVDGGPALLKSSENAASGKAMFKKFDQHTTTSYSDIERIDPSLVVEIEPEEDTEE